MLHLNLLPPDEKRTLRAAMRSRAIFAVSSGIVAIVAVYLVLLAPTFLRISLQTSDILRAVRLETENQERIGIADIVERMQATNRLADAALAADTHERSVSVRFENAFAVVPSALSLNRARYQTTTRQLAIEGFSPNRALLLTFIRGLEGLPSVASVSSPVGNLIRETDIRFTLTVTFR